MKRSPEPINSPLSKAMDAGKKNADFDNESTIYVKCVPPQACEADVINCFKAYGKIDKVYINRYTHPRWGNKFAFVKFVNEKVAEKVLCTSNSFRISGTAVYVAKRRLNNDKSKSTGDKPSTPTASAEATSSPKRQPTANSRSYFYEQTLQTIPEGEEKPCMCEESISPQQNCGTYSSFRNIGCSYDRMSQYEDNSGYYGGQSEADPSSSKAFHEASDEYPGYSSYNFTSETDSLSPDMQTAIISSDYPQTGSFTPASTKAHNPNAPKDVQTISYSLGELRIGQKKRKQFNKPAEVQYDTPVVRIDGVPEDWDATDLFNHLNGIGLPLVATLLYSDIDERKVRQGLIQLTDIHETVFLVENGEIRTPLYRFEIIPSRVKDIEDVRKTYIGKYTAFNVDKDAPKSAKTSAKPVRSLPLPITPIDEQEPNNQQHQQLFENYQMFPRNNLKRSQPCSSPSSSSFENPLGSPIVIPPSVPQQHNMASPDVFEHSPSHSFETPDIQTPMSDVSHFEAPEEYNKFTNMNALPPMMTPNSGGSMYMPITAGLKPSQTVVINNLDVRLVKEASNIAMFLSPYGRVLCADVLPINMYHSRAYVTFDNPISAVQATSYLGLCHSGPFRIQARLA